MVAEAIIHEQYEEVKRKFPNLYKPIKTEDDWRIDGSIDVVDIKGKYWDSYNVSIRIPFAYPDNFPILVETGGKIIRHEDWHNRNGICCLSTDAIIFSELSGCFTLLNWIEKFAHPFLANHVYRIKTDHYANEEFLHGTPGIIQGYFKLFATKSIVEVIRRLKIFTGTKVIGRNDPCFCGSGEKFKKCSPKHLGKDLLGIPENILKNDLQEITQYLMTNKKVSL